MYNSTEIFYHLAPINGEAEAREMPDRKGNRNYLNGVEDTIFLINEPLEEGNPAPRRFRGGDF